MCFFDHSSAPVYSVITNAFLSGEGSHEERFHKPKRGAKEVFLSKSSLCLSCLNTSSGLGNQALSFSFSLSLELLKVCVLAKEPLQPILAQK